MIKQIQLRGISRSPSDRMTSDGGCAESLNVQLDHGEIAPMPKPKDVSEEVFSEWYEEQYVRALYIHKGTYYTNYILAYDPDPGSTTERHYYVLAKVGDDVSQIAEFVYDSEETSIDPRYELASVTSVGNTLIISFNGEMRYCLFKDGEYKFLGNEIPVPKVRFYMDPDDDDRSDALSLADVEHYPSDMDTPTIDFVASQWDKYKDKGVTLVESEWGTSTNGYKAKTDLQKSVISVIIDEISKQNTVASDLGKCKFPVFVRYAVRLYDGRLYACSVPIMLGNELDEYIALKLISWKTDRDVEHAVGGVTEHYPIYEIGAAVKTPSPYTIVADFSENTEIFENDWRDIIEGIDLFVSTPILPYIDVDKILLSDRETPLSGYDWFTAEATLDPIAVSKPDKILSLHQTTYLAKSWKWKDLSSLTTVNLNDINYSGEWLATQEPMVETYHSIHEMRGENLTTYNNRLLLEGASRLLYPGYPFFPSTLPYGGDADHKFAFVWHLNINGEYKTVVTDWITERQIGEAYELPLRWLCYPDARAYEVDVYYDDDSGTYYKMTFQLESFSDIDVAYWFGGFQIGTLENTLVYSGEPSSTPYTLPTPDDIVTDDSTIYLSESGNPFIFPASGAVGFDGAKIIGTGMVTKALSQGQFGQYPLYVFTSDGIWTLGLDSEGGFISKHSVSRDVALKGTIAPIDQAIVFATKKGVLMLTGSDLVSISPDMNGKHYVLDGEVATLLETEFPDIVASTQNSESFLEYVGGSKPIYDYAGERLIFCNIKYGSYMYVYRIPTGTWHKMALASAAEYTPVFMNTINSYPDAILSMSVGGYAKAYNFSTVLEEASADDQSGSSYDPNYDDLTPGFIVTRPFDLDAPDVRKAIRDIRIRGNYNRGDVKYVLLGSFDGINWKRLTSLRGGSYKLFRLVIIANLSAHERISWIDVDFEARFTNKLR